MEEWELKEKGKDVFEESTTTTFSERSKYVKWVKILIIVACVIGVHVFLGFAIAYSFKGSIFPITLFCLIYIIVLYSYVAVPIYNKHGYRLQPYFDFMDRLTSYQIIGIPVLQASIVLVCVAGLLAWLIVDSAGNRIRLRSVAGLFMFVVLSVLVSAHPSRIKWRPVIGGLILQFCVGLLVLRWQTGHEAFQWASEQVVTFLDYTMIGAAFNYGFISQPPNICGFGSVFIYTSLQIIIYFGAIVSVLYYVGVIEAVLSKVAWVMHFTVGTTAAESLNAAACIFLGQTEAAILVEPALDTMTNSEINAIMTAGFACIAGSLFSAYISFGACPAYLLSATVMSAAVSLAVSKLIYPEIQISRQKNISDFKFKERTESNVLECISNGAVHASKFVIAIAANLLVYLALLAFLNSTIQYLGSRVGYPDLTFNQILGYCFFPLAYMMGASDASDPAVATDETLKVAELMGMKTVLNEFIAYQSLSGMISSGTLKGARAQMIATYALCGFSNISTIGSTLGILQAMCPHRKATFAKIVVRSLIGGCFSCFMTACVAGILVDIPTSCKPSVNNNCLNLDDVATYFSNKTITAF